MGGGKYFVAAIALVAYRFWQIGSAPMVQASSPIQAPQSIDVSVNGEKIRLSEESKWSIDFLGRIKNNNPTVSIVRFMNAWQSAEGKGGTFNPLNTTQEWPGATCFNPNPCVKNYPTYEAGMLATLKTFKGDYPGYDQIIRGLHTNNVKMAWEGIASSPWGTHAQLIVKVYNEERPIGETIVQVADTGSLHGTADVRLGGVPAQSHSAGVKSVVTRSMTISTGFYAGTEISGVWASAGQKNGMHWGVDFGGEEGTPVYMPFNFRVIAVGHYDDPAVEGDYIQGELDDGVVLYIGHMKDRPNFEIGSSIPAGTPIGFTNHLDHVHVQLAPKGWTGPCAQEGTCLNFVTYYNSH